MKTELKRFIKSIGATLLTLAAITFAFLWVGKPLSPQSAEWGVNFSSKFAGTLDLDWRRTYLAILDDLNVRKIKLITHWDLLEPSQGAFHFEDLDWQIKEAEKRGTKLILAVGMKTPRWPECHLPEWAANMEGSLREEALILLLKEVTGRYKESPAISMWQVENEPFVGFGKCPARSPELLREEIDTVKAIDSSRPVLVTDSGELSLWLKIAGYGDVIGTTLYRKVWLDKWDMYFTYPYAPLAYTRKAWLIKKVFGKEVLDVELQAEPWGPGWLTELSDSEKDKTMDIHRFRGIIDYASRTGLKEHYLWGAEWWDYERLRGRTEFWEEAKKLF